MKKYVSISRISTLIFSILLSISCKEKIQEAKHVSEYAEQPNVILVMTDDQGIGDLGCHGNPWIETPNIDQFYRTSVRLTDFHVSPLCTPTRSALMTGVYPIKNGVWATFKGRDMLHASLPIMPEVFRQNGYATGMFGKWHLGNNFPSRPTDKGFDIAIHHSSGGVGELSDFWSNNYFDDTYLVNNRETKFAGYCTDVWFNEAISFMKQKKDKPFFIYLSTNAPHHPLYVDKKYSEPYNDLVNKKIPSAEFYGMIANIDENFGKLVNAMKQMELEKNTILIFLTDNGSQFGVSEDYQLGWNKGFRGRKSDKLEAGHRVPFFIRWPEAGIEGGKDIDNLTSHIDLLPTLAGLCNLTLPTDFDGDGIDLSNKLLNPKVRIEERTVFVHHRQDYRQPEPIIGSGIMKADWRLLHGTELYDIKLDPEQKNNIAMEHPDVVEELLEENRVFIANAVQKMPYKELAYKEIGSEFQPKTKLTVQHAIGEDGPIWQQEEIAAGLKNKNTSHPISILKKGIYKFICRRWPEECPGSIQGIPAVNPKGLFNYQPIYPDKVKLSLFGKTFVREIAPDDDKVVFEIQLDPGRTMMETIFIEGEEEYGVYYTYIELVKESVN